MMVRLKWLLIGFFLGASFGAAGAKYGGQAPALFNRGGSCCGSDDEAAGEAPDEGPAV